MDDGSADTRAVFGKSASVQSPSRTLCPGSSCASEPRCTRLQKFATAIHCLSWPLRIFANLIHFFLAGNFPPRIFRSLSFNHGELAQLVERVVRNDEVRGSTPLLSTFSKAEKARGFAVSASSWQAPPASARRTPSRLLQAMRRPCCGAKCKRCRGAPTASSPRRSAEMPPPCMSRPCVRRCS